MKKILLLFALLWVSLIVAQKPININETNSIQASEVGEAERRNDSFFETAKRARPFNLNSLIQNHRGLSKDNQIQLDLFDNRNFNASVQRKSTDVNGVTTVVVKLKEHNFAYGYISISDNSYLFTLDIPELKEKYTTRKNQNNSTTYLFQLDPNIFKEAACGTTGDLIDDSGGSLNNIINSNNLNQIAGEAVACLPTSGEGDPADIDILVVYTPAARDFAGSVPNINTIISTAIATANTVSINNGLGITFNLANSGLVTYTENGDSNVDLDALANPSDGEMDEVHGLRENSSADLVGILTSTTDTGGLGFLLRNKFGAATSGFFLSRVQQTANTFTFIHEIGHTMGAHHHKDQLVEHQPGTSVWGNWADNGWSTGWRWLADDGNMYGDLMTYQGTDDFADGKVTTRIPYFSDPTKTQTINNVGVPIGDVVDGYNAKTLLWTKHIVAQYSNTMAYCIPTVGNSTAFYISTVNMGDIIQNLSTDRGGYSDLSIYSTCINPGETQELSATIFNSGTTTQLAVWIDWDESKVFDPDELEFASETGSGQFSVNITAPLGYQAGLKRMRIVNYTSSYNTAQACGNFTFGEIEDYTINLGESTACTTAATPVNFTITDIKDTSVKLSWDPESGVDYYELRYKEFGALDWINISSIVYPFYDLSGLSPNTHYEAQIASFCSDNLTAFSDPSIDFTTNMLTYCSAGATETLYEKISNVSFNNINQNSSSTLGYEDFTGTLDGSTDVELGVSYSFSASYSGQSYGSDQVLVWIDFNQDGDFEDDGEKVLETMLRASPWVGNISIPGLGLASLGDTTMRIRLHDANQGSNTTPCGNSTFGQVEDYTVNLILPPLNTNSYEMEDIFLYPNPFYDIITITSPSLSTSKFNLTIIDITGKRIWQQQLQSLNNKIEISGLGLLSGGIYFLKIVNPEENQNFIKKIIKY